jgi:hypothetical protein
VLTRGHLLLLTLLVFAAACTATPAVTPSPVATPTLAPTASPTQEPTATPQPATPSPEPATPEPSPTAAGAASPGLTFTPDVELEAVLPDTVGDVELAKFSMRLDQVPAGTELFLDLAETLGVPAQDVSVAIARHESDVVNVQIIALRLPGATQDELSGALLAAAEAAGQSDAITEEEVGGKQVFVERLEQVTYFYARGTDLFLVTSSEAALAEEALAQMP